MRKEYDLSKLVWKRNPYAKRLINMDLRECAASRRKAVVRWVSAS